MKPGLRSKSQIDDSWKTYSCSNLATHTTPEISTKQDLAKNLGD
jgi:hypothetical protein